MRYLGLALLLAGCPSDPAPEPAPTQKATSVSTAPSAAPTPTVTASASAAPPPSAAPPGPCPAEMVLVEGLYCPEVKHRCLQHAEDYEQAMKKRAELRAQGVDPGPLRAVERCLRYAEPGRCLSKEKQTLRFCMDRYEWPGTPGEKPLLLVTWTDARDFCREKGKRLCTSDEFNFACEGEDLLPYSHGYERDPARCNVDRPYVTPQRRLHPYRVCLDAPLCKAELERLDQRVPIGSTKGCTSPFGVHDLNGNVNEWVERPGQSPPNRSGLKGGWWGPARSRCRPMVTAHDENYVGYEVGFRCCQDAG